MISVTAKKLVKTFKWCPLIYSPWHGNKIKKLSHVNQRKCGNCYVMIGILNYLFCTMILSFRLS